MSKKGTQTKSKASTETMLIGTDLVRAMQEALDISHIWKDTLEQHQKLLKEAFYPATHQAELIRKLSESSIIDFKKIVEDANSTKQIALYNKQRTDYIKQLTQSPILEIAKSIAEASNAYTSIWESEMANIKAMQNAIVSIPFSKFTVPVDDTETRELNYKDVTLNRRYSDLSVNASQTNKLKIGPLEYTQETNYVMQIRSLEEEVVALRRENKETHEAINEIKVFLFDNRPHLLKILQIGKDYSQYKIQLGDKEPILITGRDQKKLCAVVMKDEASLRKEWSWDEIIQENENIEPSGNSIQRTQVYQAKRRLAEKIALENQIDDFFFPSKNSVKVNPKYLS